MATLRDRRRRSAVTFLEMILAIGLLILLTSMTFWFYSSALETRRNVSVKMRELRLARVVLERIGREIRQVSLITANGRIGLRGKPDRIWLSTVRMPSQESRLNFENRGDEPTGEYDLAKIEYQILSHPDIMHDDGYEYPLGLARVEIPVPRPDSFENGKAFERAGLDVGDLVAGEEGRDTVDQEEDVFAPLDEDLAPNLETDVRWDELYAREIRYLRFCYYDGHSWWNEWDIAGENPLPQIVQVTIGFLPRPGYGDEISISQEEEEFCSCLNDDNLDECEPMPADTHTILVRVPQADTLFRSRIARESQALLQDLGL